MFAELSLELNSLLGKAAAYNNITKREKEAYEYCQKYLMPEAWGKNVWHAILDDAIRMRKENEHRPNKEINSPSK